MSSEKNTDSSTGDIYSSLDSAKDDRFEDFSLYGRDQEQSLDLDGRRIWDGGWEQHHRCEELVESAASGSLDEKQLRWLHQLTNNIRRMVIFPSLPELHIFFHPSVFN